MLPTLVTDGSGKSITFVRVGSAVLTCTAIPAVDAAAGGRHERRGARGRGGGADGWRGRLAGRGHDRERRHRDEKFDVSASPLP